MELPYLSTGWDIEDLRVYVDPHGPIIDVETKPGKGVRQRLAAWWDQWLRGPLIDPQPALRPVRIK